MVSWWVCDRLKLLHLLNESVIGFSEIFDRFASCVSKHAELRTEVLDLHTSNA